MRLAILGPGNIGSDRGDNIFQGFSQLSACLLFTASQWDVLGILARALGMRG